MYSELKKLKVALGGKVKKKKTKKKKNRLMYGGYQCKMQLKQLTLVGLLWYLSLESEVVSNPHSEH